MRMRTTASSFAIPLGMAFLRLASFAFLISTLPFSSILAQQEAQFTQYMFNSLVYNPAYAGSKEYLSVVAIYRDQWFGLGSTNGKYDGRPVTQTFSVHSPVNKRVGLGLNVVNERIGARQTSLVNVAYTYRLSFGEGTLSLGLQAGAMHWRADWDELEFKDARELDGAFDGPDPTLLIPDFGGGIYYYTRHFYAGASIPHLGHFDLRGIDSLELTSIRKWARTYRHFYVTAGGAIPLKNGNIVFKPSVLVKSVGFFNEFFKEGNLVREIGAPATFDVDASFLFQNKFWAGAAFRSAFAAFSTRNRQQSSYDSFDIWTAWLFDNGLRIGFAYDYPLGKLRPFATGSFEVMLGYDFFKSVNKVNSPRYF